MKNIIASVIALGLMGGVAHAANSSNTVIFHGAVSATTCDITPSQNGQILTAGTIYLGTVAPNAEGQAKEFALKAKDASDPACMALTAQQTASVAWTSAFLNANGLNADPSSSVATDAKVLLNSVNAKMPGAITASANTADFTADKVIGEGLKFSAKAKGGAIPGTFQTAASFSVAYK
ncbi:fimbrial protein [Escherichia coli]|uniref:fimbrial protein n=1 Tax=Escherichia coli TaxID=562 RepID=UPI001F5B2C80|nr:fimbrial protein [Escherichia coli]MCI3086819.1 fimbrial protein [Escherichia coli]